jgi:hypothetical protein
MLTAALLSLASLPVSCVAVSAAAPGQPGFDESFTGRTLRFDYLHVGTAGEEHVAPAGFRLEGGWPGSRTELVDTTDLGKYLFEVRDLATHRVIWSRGFCSIYGEWETTGAAKAGWGAFEESQRFPEPRQPVQLVLHERADDGTFRELFSTTVDPASRFVDRSPVAPRGESFEVFVSGPAASQVDLLVLADGYTADEAGKFRADADRLVGALFSTEPFRSRRDAFSVRGLHVAAAEPGISNPRKDAWRDAPLGTSFNAFDVDRYVLTYRDRELREIAAQLPYDALIIVFNDRKYGGGGIFNLWATCSADTEVADYVFVHEFGHSFAGLADEYYTSQVAYEEFTPPGTEPWEPNVTALLDPARLKWRDLVEAGTGLPTPWDKERYDADDLAYQAKRKALIERGASEEESEALMREVKASSTPFLRAQEHFGRVGAFEGAGYQSRGLYRPEVDCIMFTRNPTAFCKVCERAVNRVIDLYAR